MREEHIKETKLYHRLIRTTPESIQKLRPAPLSRTMEFAQPDNNAHTYRRRNKKYRMTTKIHCGLNPKYIPESLKQVV